MDTDFESICRTCMRKDQQLEHIFSENLETTLNRCFHLRISKSDKLPQKICVECIDVLKKVRNFDEQCQKADKDLRKTLEAQFPNVKIKEEVIEEEDDVPAGLVCEAFMLEDSASYSDDYEDQKPSFSRKAIKSESYKHEFFFKEKHKPGPPAECHHCGKIYSTKDKLRRHFLKDSCQQYPGIATNPPTCTDCGLKFTSNRGLSSHKESKRCGDARLLCEICKCVFSSMKALRRHHYVHLGLKYECDICSRAFIRPDLMEGHKRREHGSTGDVSNIKLEYDKDVTGGYLCKFSDCGMKLRDMDSLRRHTKSQHNPELFCHVCSVQYVKRKVFREHMKSEHGIESAVKTETYECDTCHKIFSNKFKLKEHSITHSNERNHLCGVCGLGFKSQTTLRYHEQRHSGIKAFKCDSCPKSYYLLKELKAHAKVHTVPDCKPWICAECGRGYARSDSLNNHLRMHRNERPHECEVCLKRFLKKDHLKIHMRIHTGERLFACQYCEQRFTQKYDMIKHERRHQEHQGISLVVKNPV